MAHSREQRAVEIRTWNEPLMARMAIDDSFMRDPRVIRLSKLCGWSRRETNGCLLDVYAVVYDRASETILAADVDTAAELEGFAEKMVEVGLASPVTRVGFANSGSLLRISGAKKRIKYLKTREESGRQGGIKSGITRRNRNEAKTKVTFEANEATVNPPDPDSLKDKDKKATAPQVAIPLLDPKPAHQPAIAAFDSYFRDAHGGSKPTWVARTVAMVKGLVSKHGAPEVVSRIDVLRLSPPVFPPQPWDLATFVQHFDKCIAPRARTREHKPDEDPQLGPNSLAIFGPNGLAGSVA